MHSSVVEEVRPGVEIEGSVGSIIDFRTIFVSEKDPGSEIPGTGILGACSGLCDEIDATRDQGGVLALIVDLDRNTGQAGFLQAVSNGGTERLSAQ